MAHKRTPVEIWSTILSLVFEFPLDTEPNPRHQRATEHEYWISEQQRGTLRLVCRTWRDIVDQKTHRFLYMWDFVDLELPPSVLRNAQKISFTLPSLTGCRHTGSRCSSPGIITSFKWLAEKWPEGFQGRSFERIAYWKNAHRKLLSETFIHHISTTTAQLRVQTISHPSDKCIFNLDAATWETVGRFSNLTTLELGEGPTVEELQFILSPLQHLVHLRFYLHQTSSCPTIKISLPNLQSLQFRGHLSALRDLHFSEWNLPSLQHINFIITYLSLESIFQAVSPFKENLKSLQVGPEVQVNGRVIDDQVWDYFPNLELLDWLTTQVAQGPPDGHPPSTVLYDPLRPYHSRIEPPAVLERWLTLCPSIRKLKVMTKWRGLLANYTSRDLMDLVDLIGNRFATGLSVVDIDETPWEELYVSVRRCNPQFISTFGIVLIYLIDYSR